MRSFPRPIVVVSQCLELAACRYDGRTMRAPIVVQLAPYVELRPICPEVEIGLGIPRDPIRLITVDGTRRLVQPTTMRDVTAAMREFTATFLATAADADGFILKSKSPSCGTRDTNVYPTAGAPWPVGKGAGMFGSAVLTRFPQAAVEDERRLTQRRFRHHFLVKLFTRAAFRAARNHEMLIRFHAEHELQLQAYNRTAKRALDRIIALAADRPFSEIMVAYDGQLARSLARPARERATIDTLMSALGRLEKRLSAAEKQELSGALDEYRKGRLTLDGPLTLLRCRAGVLDDRYLASQTFLQPYPPPLMDAQDA